MITQFGEAVATSPDGIAIMGHPGDDAFKPLVDDAVASGIVVTVMNTELAETEAAHMTAGTGYVGAVLYKAGGDLAREAIKRGGLEAGDQVFLWGLEAQPGRGERTLGIHDALNEAGMDVIYLEIDDATNADPSAGISTFTGMASANPDLKAAFLDHGNVTSTARAYLEAAGIAPEALYVAGFDLAPATIEGIQTGYVDLAIDQQQWLQGFEAVAPDLPEPQLRLQWPVHRHRRRFRRFQQHRHGRAARRAADSLVTDQHVVSDDVRAGEGSDPRQAELPRLELRNIYKSFGGVDVLEDVSFKLTGGEVVGLLGDNGAGKSTLIKVVTGVHQPDQGEIRFGGRGESET